GDDVGRSCPVPSVTSQFVRAGRIAPCRGARSSRPLVDDGLPQPRPREGRTPTAAAREPRGQTPRAERAGGRGDATGGLGSSPRGHGGCRAYRLPGPLGLARIRRRFLIPSRLRAGATSFVAFDGSASPLP